MQDVALAQLQGSGGAEKFRGDCHFTKKFLPFMYTRIKGHVLTTSKPAMLGRK